jgi:polyisoprenoid-binding protein YceI
MNLKLSLLIALCLAVAACAPVQTSPTLVPPSPVPTTVQPSPPATPADITKYQIVPEQSEARYRVREQLARLNFPSDAVGSTKAITGTVAVDSKGNMVPEASLFQVDLSSLRSDEGRRDNFIRQNTLDTAKYPYARFVPKEIKGLPSPLPTSGQVSFQLIGDLTLRDVTRSVTWDVTANLQGDQVKGQAKTTFTFADFKLSKPTVMVVLSVDDNINLEVDFTLQRLKQ